jgi:hypothetical protein
MVCGLVLLQWKVLLPRNPFHARNPTLVCCYDGEIDHRHLLWAEETIGQGRVVAIPCSITCRALPELLPNTSKSIVMGVGRKFALALDARKNGHKKENEHLKVSTN